MPTPEARCEVEKALRGQGVLTESLVQWLADLDMMLADLCERVSKLERALADAPEET